MKAKHLGNGNAKLKNNSNASMKKGLKNKMRKKAARVDVLKPIATNKLKEAERFSNSPDTVQKEDQKCVPDGAAKSPGAAASRKKKRSSSTTPVKKSRDKKFKEGNSDVPIFPSIDELNSKKNDPCDENASTISVQSGSQSTANSSRSSLILDNDDKDVCSDQIHQQTFCNRSIDRKLTELANLSSITETSMPFTTESVSLDTTDPQRESDAGNLDQSRGDFTATSPGTFRPDHYENTYEFSRSIRKGSSYTSFTGYCTVGKARKKLLVSMRPINRLVIEGCYCIKPVVGMVRILGYTVSEGEKKAVFSPRHRALIPVMCAHEGVSMMERYSQEEDWRSKKEEESREAGVGPQEEGAPRLPPRHPSGGVRGGLGVVLTEEVMDSLRSTYGLDDTDLASLHLEIGAPFIVVELSSYRSRLPEVLRHIAVPSLVMDQQLGRLTSAPLSSLLPGATCSDTTNSKNKGPLSAVHYVASDDRDGEDSQDLPVTDECGPVIDTEQQSKSKANTLDGLTLPPPSLVKQSPDHSNTLRNESNPQEHGEKEPNTENKPDKECPLDEVPPATTEVGRPSNTCDVNEWFSVLGGAKPRIHSMGQAPLVAVPDSWYQAVQEFKAEEVEVEISGFRLYPKRRVVIIGDKGAGKSTFLKYFINSMVDSFDEHDSTPSTPKSSSCVKSEPEGLNKKEGPRSPRRSVCCLDLDPGQPEQSLPGSLSVCLYRKPLLGPAFTYGLATAKSSKELSDKKKMFERRRKMVQQLLSLQKGTTITGRESSKFTELTELLEDAENLDQTLPGEITKQLLLGDVSPALKPNLYVDVVRELMETVRSEHSDEPLVVNTMGWLSEMGMTFLLDILNIVSPTHVIHLTSDRRLELDCHYMSHLFKEKQPGSVSTVNPIFNYDYFQIMAPASTAPVFRKNRKPPGPRDLRTLMFTSYFTSLWSADSSTTLDVTTCKIGVKLKYTDLAVYDLRRFSDEPLALLENMRQNMALVALCSTDETNVFTAGKESPKRVELSPQCKVPLNNFFGDQTYGQDSRKILIRQNTETHRLFKYVREQANNKSKIPMDGSKEASTLTDRVCNLSRTKRRAAFEVHGWAIVLAVDASTKEVHLLTPTPDTALPKTNTLVRTNVDLPNGFEKLISQSLNK